MSNQVNFESVESSNGKYIGIATLNSPKTLNALNISMVKQLLAQLRQWQIDSEIALVVLQGEGGKAFCAGGDVVSLYHDLKSRQQNNLGDFNENILIDDKAIKQSLAAEFFQQEYQLDLLIHQYEKPIMVWGNGYVIGGGLGLFAGASHRVVTENTIMAMPEISIGLYPDVGASYFLNNMPKNIGLFLGLTGAMFNGNDAIYLGIADYGIKQNNQSQILSQLKAIKWQGNQGDHLLLADLLQEFDLTSAKHLPTSLIYENTSEIEGLLSERDFNGLINAIRTNEFASEFLQRAQAKLSKGSPLSAYIIHRQLQNCHGKSLAQCFHSELQLSLRCCQYAEFSEGVRALLVDKDKAPKWVFQYDEPIPEQLELWFFSELT